LNKLFSLLVFFVLLLIPLGIQDVFAQTDIQFDVVCTSTGQLCDPAFTTDVTTDSILQVQYFVSPNHCSSVRVHIFLDNTQVHTTDFLGWLGAPSPFDTLELDSGIIDLGPVSPGMHTVGIQAEGQQGGCNSGELIRWEGSMRVFTEEIQETPDKTTIPVVGECTSTGQLCTPIFSNPIQTDGLLQIMYMVPNTHCSSVRLNVFLDNNLVETTDFLGWLNAPPPFDTLALETEIIDLGPVSPGIHTVGIQAEGQQGGCNVGELVRWKGTLMLFTGGYIYCSCWRNDSTRNIIFACRIYDSKFLLDCTYHSWNWCRNLFGKEKN